jgi:hypothetical protein
MMPKRKAHSEDGSGSLKQRQTAKRVCKSVDEKEAQQGPQICIKESEEILRGRLPFADGQVFFVESFVESERGERWLEGLKRLDTCALEASLLYQDHFFALTGSGQQGINLRFTCTAEKWSKRVCQ